ncbi:hypothetical protein BYT27DRAFT_7097490 [Phlegmacium glaucopus]|nr:hypothetical protein BYT27DRAFT_7097490 [Phlegmacium glaucopus]
MDDQPYTTADEDPFNVQTIVQQVKSIKHRRSSLLDKWILEQQQNPTECPNTLHLPKPRSSASASFSNPYLAYPDLPRVTSFDTAGKEDTCSIISYDFVDDNDIPANVAPEGLEPSIPLPPRTIKIFRHSLTPSLRHLNLPFRSPTSNNTESSSSRAFSRLSIFQRTPRSSIGVCSNNDNTPHIHSRSSSILTHTRSISQQSTNADSRSPRATARWRPSVLGHFYQPSASQSSILVSETHSTPSRPSISSADTYNTSSTSRTATTIESNIISTPPKIPPLDCIGSRNTLLPAALNLPTASGSSVWLSGHELDGNSRGTDCQIVPRQRTAFTDDNVDDQDHIDPPPTSCTRYHDTIRPSIPYSSARTLPRVKFSSLNTRSQRKKKKLVISGIGVDETRKFEGIKRWCEITRMPNGDLHIDFRDSEVADTVCRVRAKVHIAGVGSVQLSWFAGQKR